MSSIQQTADCRLGGELIRARWSAFAVVFGVLGATAPVSASDAVYDYSVHHPVYGEIGNLVYRIERTADTRRISSQLRIAITILGITAYRYEADTVEAWRGDRLVMLLSELNKDGNFMEVHGEARDGRFLVTSNAGTFTASPDVAPPDPWLVRSSGTKTVISTSTGRVLDARISGGESMTLPIQGADVAVRHFSIDDDKHQEVWLDEHNIPVMMRSVEAGDRIDFILTTPLVRAAQTAIAEHR